MEVPKEAYDDSDVLRVLILKPLMEGIPYAKATVKKDKVTVRYDGQDFEIKVEHFCALSALFVAIHGDLHEMELVTERQDDSLLSLLRKLFRGDDGNN